MDYSLEVADWREYALQSSPDDMDWIEQERAERRARFPYVVTFEGDAIDDFDRARHG
jgi:hypothetical protein